MITSKHQKKTRISNMIETILAFLERETKNPPIWVVDSKLVSVTAGTLRLLIIVIWHQTSLLASLLSDALGVTAV